MYKLKPNAPDFTVVDGPFAGRTFKAGVKYPEIPPQEKHRFEKVVIKPAKLPVKKEEETES